jgi:hypothetical protein
MRPRGDLLIGRIYPPKRVGLVPKTATWLSGEAGGVWFEIMEKGENYRIKRYSLDGELDCDREFKLVNSETIDLNEPFVMAHTSHCALVRVNQNGVLFVFEYIYK